MAEKRSLLDDSAFEKIGAKARGAGKPASGTSGDQKKWVIALCLFVVAGGLLCWQMGLFDRFAKPVPATGLTPSEVQAKEQQAEEGQKALEQGNVSRGAS